MLYMTHDWIGTLHLGSAIAALITGTMVLSLRKGTARHKKIGYIYAGSMVVVVATAFMIYRLFGGFGIFHIAAVVSGVTLIGGMVPAILRKPNNWVMLHFSFMYWSVLGLYMAFASELMTRIPNTLPYYMLGVSTGTIGFIGGAWFYYRKKYWAEKFTNA